MHVTALGYIGLGVADPAAWLGFATGVAGFEVADGPGLRLRTDARAWRIALERSPVNDVLYLGWETGGPDMLTDLACRLASAGIAVEHDDGTLAARRGVAGIVRCADPSGLTCEFFWGARDGRAFRSPTGMRGFVGENDGLGHVSLTTRDLGASRRFYEELVGLRLTGTMGFSVGPESSIDVAYLRCNARHHALSLASIPVPRLLHHLMVETLDPADLAAAMDRAVAARVNVTDMGRHANGGLLSFYSRSPAGFQLELGWGGGTVDDATWRPVRHHGRMSVWGHRPV